MWPPRIQRIRIRFHFLSWRTFDPATFDLFSVRRISTRCASSWFSTNPLLQDQKGTAHEFHVILSWVTVPVSRIWDDCPIHLAREGLRARDFLPAVPLEYLYGYNLLLLPCASTSSFRLTVWLVKSILCILPQRCILWHVLFQSEGEAWYGVWYINLWTDFRFLRRGQNVDSFSLLYVARAHPNSFLVLNCYFLPLYDFEVYLQNYK